MSITTVTHPIAIVVPSRSRPGNIAELLDAWETTAAGGHAELVVAVDDDDPHLAGYLELDWPAVAEWARLHVGPRLRLGGTLNELAPQLARLTLELTAETGGAVAAVGFMGDDHRPRSLAWDRELRLELAFTELAVVYGNDLIQGERLPTAVVLDARIVDRLGYMVPPGAVHLFLDNYWRRLGEELGTLRYRPDIVIEHAHPIAGGAAWDDQYREVNADHVWTADEARFRRWVDEELDDAITTIRGAA